MYRRIVAAYDGSPGARKAFEAALAAAKRDEAELHVITVSQPPEIGDDVETEAVIESSKRFHRGLLAELRGELGTSGVKAHYEVLVGHAASQIIDYADRVEADLIVVGSKGRSRLAQVLLGSVSRHVVQHADRPVLVVR